MRSVDNCTNARTRNGIRKNCITELELFWEIEKCTELPARPKPSASSFSCASLDQPVVYRTPEFAVVDSESPLGDMNIELLDFSMDLTGEAIGGSYSVDRPILSTGSNGRTSPMG